MRAYYLQEAFQLFGDYGPAITWRNGCGRPLRSRLEPFKRFVRMLRGHLWNPIVPGIESLRVLWRDE